MLQKTDFYVISDLTPNKLLSLVKNAEKNQIKWTKRFSSIKNYTELFYEDIIGEKKNNYTYMNEKENEKLCFFLNVPFYPIYSSTKKKNKRSIFDYLPDPQGTLNLFKGTPYEWMLKE